MSKPVLAVLVCVAAACGGTRPAVETPRALLARGDYAGAERAADRGLADTPRDGELWRLKIESIQRQGEHRRAADAYLSWHKLRRHYDPAAIRLLAIGALRAAAADPSPGVRAAAHAAIRRLDPGELRELSRAALDDPDAGVRARAAAATLGRDDRARAVLGELAASPDAAVRAIAIRALARAGDARALAIAALADPAPEVRRAAVFAVDRLGGDGTDDRLLAAARDPDGTVRAEALDALADRGTDRRIAAATAALEDDYLGARLAGIRVLAGDRDHRGRAALAALATSTDAYVALRAAVTLRKWGQPVTDDAVERALGDRRWNVRVAALNAVAEVTRRDTALDLVAAALVDERVEVQLAAARVLARLGATGRAAQTFYAALESADEDARIQGAVGLVRMRDDGGARALGTMLSSPHATTRAAAAAALAQTRDITLPLVAAVGDDDVRVRIAAAATLLEVGRRSRRR